MKLTEGWGKPKNDSKGEDENACSADNFFLRD